MENLYIYYRSLLRLRFREQKKLNGQKMKNDIATRTRFVPTMIHLHRMIWKRLSIRKGNNLKETFIRKTHGIRRSLMSRMTFLYFQFERWRES